MNDLPMPVVSGEFEWFDKQRPGILDVLIGLEEHKCIPVTDGSHLYLLVVSGSNHEPDAAPVPSWLGRGLVANRTDIISRIARRYYMPPGTKLPGISPA